MTVSLACDLALSDIVAELSPTSQHTYRWHSKTIQEDFGGSTKLELITRLDVQQWINLQRGQLAAATIRHRVSFLNRLYRVALDHGLDLKNPTKDTRRPKISNARDRVLEAHEETALREVCRPETYTVIEFACMTGLRRLEQWRLASRDIKMWVANTVSLPNGEEVPIYHGLANIRTSKTGNPRVCPLNPVACAIALLWQSRGTEYLFGPQTDNRFQAAKDWAKTKWTPVRKAAGVKDLHWHDLRHTAATRAYRNGAKPEEVKQLLGHTTLLQTDRYIQWGEEPAFAAAMAISRGKVVKR